MSALLQFQFQNTANAGTIRRLLIEHDNMRERLAAVASVKLDGELSVEELTLLDHHRRCDARGKSMILISASVASKSSEEHAARPRCEVIDIGPKR